MLLRARHHRFLVFGLMTALLLVATTTWAKFDLLAHSIQRIDGVSLAGNPSTTLGRKSVGKIYKDLNTGVVLQISQARVENLFKFSKAFRNRGLTMFDPQTYETLTSTSDYTLVSVRTNLFQGTQNDTGWGAVEVKVYDPQFAPVP